jgi:hypothetical protein
MADLVPPPAANALSAAEVARVDAPEPKRAPPGFTPEHWQEFLERGFLHFDDVLGTHEINGYLEAIERVTAADSRFKSAEHYARHNAVQTDPGLVDMIDRATHVGYAYDLYGELTKLHLSQFMLRPRGGNYNLWHPDGARALPYGVFSPILPLQFKVAYWLTDVPRPKMGNLVLMPGSHTQQYLTGYDTDKSLPGELVLCPRRGSMTLIHASTWHRVDPNETDVVRKNIFLTYSPSWIVSEDRYECPAEWLAGLARERRILMRSYSFPYSNQKPPKQDFPLYLDRETGADRDPGAYEPHVEIHRRKRLTFHEKLLGHGDSGKRS